MCATLALAACAGPLAQRRDAGGSAEARGAWRALVEGRPDEAARAFDARVAAAPDDPLARFGRATLAYDRGDGPRALDDYTAVLVAAARARRGDETATLVAPVAAARALALDDDVAPSRRALDEATLLALPEPRRCASGPAHAESASDATIAAQTFMGRSPRGRR